MYSIEISFEFISLQRFIFKILFEVKVETLFFPIYLRKAILFLDFELFKVNVFALCAFSALGKRNSLWVESVLDFLIKLDIKPSMHLVEISIFSLNHVIIRLTKIKNNLLEHLKIRTFKDISLYQKLVESFQKRNLGRIFD